MDFEAGGSAGGDFGDDLGEVDFGEDFSSDLGGGADFDDGRDDAEDFGGGSSGGDFGDDSEGVDAFDGEGIAGGDFGDDAATRHYDFAPGREEPNGPPPPGAQVWSYNGSDWNYEFWDLCKHRLDVPQEATVEQWVEFGPRMMQTIMGEPEVIELRSTILDKITRDAAEILRELKPGQSATYEYGVRELIHSSLVPPRLYKTALTLGRFTMFCEVTGIVGPKWVTTGDVTYTIDWIVHDVYDFAWYVLPGWLGGDFHIYGLREEYGRRPVRQAQRL